MAITYPYTVPADRAFMGKARTYSAQTQFRQHAVRLRALKDSPRNPAEPGAIGPQGDWAVDDPMAVVEEGSNANGSYTLYAGGTGEVHKEFSASLSSSTWGHSGPLPIIATKIYTQTVGPSSTSPVQTVATIIGGGSPYAPSLTNFRIWGYSSSSAGNVYGAVAAKIHWY